MPYKSLAQMKYFNANRDKMEAQGVDVNEWNAASKGDDLPKKVNTSLRSLTRHLPRRGAKAAATPR